MGRSHPASSSAGTHRCRGRACGRAATSGDLHRLTSLSAASARRRPRPPYRRKSSTPLKWVGLSTHSRHLPSAPSAGPDHLRRIKSSPYPRRHSASPSFEVGGLGWRLAGVSTSKVLWDGAGRWTTGPCAPTDRARR